MGEELGRGKIEEEEEEKGKKRRQRRRGREDVNEVAGEME